MALKTERLDLDRVKNQGFTTTPPGVIVDAFNTLTSEQRDSLYAIKKNIVSYPSGYSEPGLPINSERLDYFTQINHAFYMDYRNCWK